MPLRACIAFLLLCSAHAMPIDEIRALDEKFGKLYNSADYDGVQAMYRPDATLIPPTADAFIPQSGLADFFKQSASMGIKNVNLVPLQVTEEADGLTRHEIGNCTHSLQPNGGRHYVRWAKYNAGEWRLMLDIMAIGE